MIWTHDEKFIFQGFRRLSKSILAFLPNQILDRVEVEKAKFKVTSYLLYLIFYFLTNRKLVFREV
jgi:hypothetical protein